MKKKAKKKPVQNILENRKREKKQLEFRRIIRGRIHKKTFTALFLFSSSSQPAKKHTGENHTETKDKEIYKMIGKRLVKK